MTLEKSFVNLIADVFGIKGKYYSCSRINTGHINSTYVLCFENTFGMLEKYVLQNINVEVFKKPDELMQNIISVTSHIRNKISDTPFSHRYDTLDFLRAADGKFYYLDQSGSYWRCYKYIDDVYTCDIIKNPELFYNAGVAFGTFQNLLHDFSIESLFDTIPDFHHTEKRFSNFKTAIDANISKRIENVRAEIDFALAREADTKLVVSLLEKGELPYRVTHNDTKLNNILFDNNTDIAICVIDLDTVMKGSALYDFGDSIRFGANTANEDEKDLSKVSLDLSLYTKYVDGYLSKASKSLTEKEVELLPFASKLMTFECGMRFLTDYLNGDTYFRVAHPEHNLDRCRTQFSLVTDIEKKYDEMCDITQKLYTK